MKASLYCLLAITLITSGVAAPTLDNKPSPPPTAKELAQGYRDRFILARPRAAQASEASAAETRLGVELHEQFSRLGNLRVLKVAEGEDPADVVAQLAATGAYEFVQPDYIRYLRAVPNDPKYTDGSLWGLNNTGQHGNVIGVPGADIDAIAAWDIIHDAPNVVVAVVDTGVNLNHQDIAPNLWTNPAGGSDLRGANFVGGNGRMVSGSPMDDEGHGTHVAGTIGAVGNNGTGITGVAWRVQIMAVKVMDSSGRGSVSDIVGGINYAVSKGAHIINASFGAAGADNNYSQAELNAIEAARAAGIIFVAAAGNDGGNVDISRTYPASFAVDNIVTVGNSNRRDEISSSSNFGASVDLFAPGEEIVSLLYSNNTGTVSSSGTSMAAPHVAGAFALLKAQFPGDTYRQLINRMLRGVDRGDRFTGKSQTGGRLNLLKALTSTTNRPFNDDFADRPRFVTANDNLSIRTNNTGATAEASDPAIGGFSPTATLWWEWTAPAGGTVSVDTRGSSYDTLLAVFRGTTPGSLALVTSNDDEVSRVTSRLTFTAEAGVTYQIAVDGKSGATGLTLLNLGTTPSNDAFATPVILAGNVSVQVTATNLNASRESGEPTILGFSGGNSLWYQWTAPRTGQFQVAATSTDFDPLLAVYTGTSVNALTMVSASDNTGTDNAQTAALCTISATAGTTYRITIDSKTASTTGQFTLSIVDSLWQATTGDSITCAPSVGPDGSVYVGSTDRVFYAFASDGSLRWTVTTGGLLDSSSAAVGDDGTVYFGSNDGYLYAVAANGTTKWKRQFVTGSTAIAGAYSPAIGSDGTIYARASDGYLHAFNPADGAEKWKTDVRSTQSSFYGNPVVGPDGTIYQGSDEVDKTFFALNTDGSIKWQVTLDSGVYGAPAIDSAGNLYIATLTGPVYSLKPDGSQRWKVTSGGSISSSVALSADGATLYYAGYDMKLYARDTSNGAVRWTYDLGDEVRASSPAVDGSGVIYIGCYDGKVYAVNANGTLNRVYDTGDWIRSSPTISGNRLYFGSNDQKLYAFDLGAGASGGTWSQYRANARHLGRAVAQTLAITTQPSSQTAVLGGTLTLSVTATGPGAITYQWKKDGAAISGATSATYSVSNVTAATAGTYTVEVKSGSSTTTSAGAVVTVETASPGRLMNVSVRTTAGSGGNTLIVGFALTGSGSKPLLVRGIGPTLSAYLSGAMAEPQLRVTTLSGTTLAANSGWGGGDTLAATFASVGAFPLDRNSKDAALVTSLPTGTYTAQITGANDASGIVLAEAYDLDAAAGSPSARLVNVSARAHVGTGGGILIAGFVISGNVPKKLLIRGVGPGLAQFLSGYLADPKLEIYRADNTKVAENNDWGGAADVMAAFQTVGASPGLSTTSADSALLLTLPPGSYTAQVSGVNSTTGIALVDVYEVP